ncbi:MAG: TolC family protein [Acidobacteriota bacterium]|nr:TolC family protein [Acidobacteriota bacterium]
MFLLPIGIRTKAQTNAPLTWAEVQQRFEQNNPTLHAGQTGISESRAEEITAYLRPNPQLAVSEDGTQIAPSGGVWTPFTGTFEVAQVSYLHERDHKRELRLKSAQEGTDIAISNQADLQRTLLFSLRTAFVDTLQAKAVLQLAQDNLAYWDRVLGISHDRLRAGDISGIDMDRLELQRVQFESDVQTAEVNLRTAKIQLLELLNERTPVDRFDVTGPFDYSDQLPSIDEIRQMARANRPDVRAAMQAVDQARVNHKLAIADGSTDPTLGAWYTHNSSNNNPNGLQTLGFSVDIPLRIFDRNQGEKLRTQLDITRNQQLVDATQAQVFGDVDSAYAQVNSDLSLLRPYKQTYLAQAGRVRETVRLSYEHGAASLLDFLSAEGDYRNIQLSYLNLIGSYLTAAAQLNLAVGREAIQ